MGAAVADEEKRTRVLAYAREHGVDLTAGNKKGRGGGGGGVADGSQGLRARQLHPYIHYRGVVSCVWDTVDSAGRERFDEAFI